jgi:hypothetical protein
VTAPDTTEQPRIGKEDALQLLRSALSGQALRTKIMNGMQHRVEQPPYDKRRSLSASELAQMIRQAEWSSVENTCADVPGVVGSRLAESLAAVQQHIASCDECAWIKREADRLLSAAHAAILAAITHYGETGQLTAPDTTAMADEDDGAFTQRCAECGRRYTPARSTSKFHSDNCRKLHHKRKKAAEEVRARKNG